MKRIISLISIISISGILLIGCGNTDTKKDDVSSLTEVGENTEYTISSTETSNGKKVTEEEGTVLINKEGIKTKVADSKGNKINKDLDDKLRKMCEEISKVCESKDIEAYPIDSTLYLNIAGDVDVLIPCKQKVIDFLKTKPIEGYNDYVQFCSRESDKSYSFEVK
jgi:hypothetical protein